MTLSVSPYLTAPPSGRSPRPAADSTSAPQNSGDAGASAKDSISLSPTAEQALAAVPPDAIKPPPQSAMEKILAGIRNGPNLFRSAPDNSTGKNLDQSI
jgi:hypothetical protein